MVQTLMWEEFLGSSVDCYMKTSPRLFCADITRGEDSCNRGKEFLCSNVDFTSGLLPYCFAQMSQATREESIGKKGLNFLLFSNSCLDKYYKITSSSCQLVKNCMFLIHCIHLTDSK